MKLFAGFCRYLLIIGAFLLTACAAPVLGPDDWQDASLNRVWPEPPQTSRIETLRIIGSESDLRDDGDGRFFAWLFGEAAGQLPLVSPYGIAADGKGRVWVADPAGSVVHIFDLAGKKVDYVAQIGKDRLVSPVGLAYNPRLNLFYVSDSILKRVFVLDPEGTPVGEIILSAGFGRPAGLAVGPDNDIFVADVLTGKVERFSAAGDHVRSVFSAVGDKVLFNRPTNVAVDKAGQLIVTDSMNFRVEVQSPQGELVQLIGFLGDTPGGLARPRGVAVDSDGHLYVVDAAFDNVQIFDMTGSLLMYFGQPGSEAGEFCLPAGIFIDQADRIYLSESCNSRFQVFQYKHLAD